MAKEIIQLFSKVEDVLPHEPKIPAAVTQYTHTKIFIRIFNAAYLVL